MLGFLVVIYIWVKRNPEVAPIDDSPLENGERRVAAIKCWPAMLLFTIIIGGIYGTEYERNMTGISIGIFFPLDSEIAVTISWNHH